MLAFCLAIQNYMFVRSRLWESLCLVLIAFTLFRPDFWRDRVSPQAGLICYPAQGTIDGCHGDHVLLISSFIIAEAEMDLLVKRLGYAITEAVG